MGSVCCCCRASDDIHGGGPQDENGSNHGNSPSFNRKSQNLSNKYRTLYKSGQFSEVEVQPVPEPVKMEEKESSLNFLPEEDEDVCPTCLEEYTEENPKILTHCSHHYHLSCIYEWLERRETCPVCGRLMEFDE